MLEARNISVVYGGRPVVDNVSLTLPGGKVSALIGPNGAGKSTLLRALNGTVHLAMGEVLLDGRSLHGLSRAEIARHTAVIAQEAETRFPVTVLEFVLSGRFVNRGVFGWETQADLDAASRAIADCELNGYAGRRMNELSGGERQRVVLARALATSANILLLDEPTANLDLAHQAMMFRLVRERCRASAAAAMVITHDLNLAAEFADTVLLIDGGRIAASGAPEHVLTPENISRIFGVKVLADTNPATGNVRVTNVFQ